MPGESPFSTASDAAGYDAWYHTPVGRLTDRLEKEAVFSLLREAPGRALDLSCGAGRYALELQRRGWRVVGVDRSLAMPGQAQAASGGRPQGPSFVAGDAGQLPMRRACFDLVTLVLGPEFMEDPSRALAEPRRVLTPGGILIVAVLAHRGLWTLWRRFKRIFRPSVWREVHFLSLGADANRLVVTSHIPARSPATPSARPGEPLRARTPPRRQRNSPPQPRHKARPPAALPTRSPDVSLIRLRLRRTSAAAQACPVRALPAG